LIYLRVSISKLFLLFFYSWRNLGFWAVSVVSTGEISYLFFF